MPSELPKLTTPPLARAVAAFALAAAVSAWGATGPEPPPAVRGPAPALVRDFRRTCLVATLTVMPVRLDGAADADAAAAIARRLTRAGVSHGCAVGPPLPASAAGSLAELAVVIRARLQAEPVDSDFALVVDFRPGTVRRGPARVDVILCDAAGDPVLAEERVVDAAAGPAAWKQLTCDAAVGVVCDYVAGGPAAAQSLRP